MKRLQIVMLAALLLVLAACGQKDTTFTVSDPTAVTASADTTSKGEGGYQTITPQDAKALLDAGARFTLVDVRTEAEYTEAHIPSAIHIENEGIGNDRPQALPELDAAIVVYCRSGRRSKEAANKLIDMGYTDVRDLGGITSWPYDTVTGAEPGEWTPSQSASAGILSSFSTTDLEGNAVDEAVLQDYELTMVNAWATYCGPCLREMPDLGELAEEYKDQHVQIVGFVTDVLNSDGSLSEKQLETAQDVVSSTQANYLHIVPSRPLFGLLSQITSVPTTFFVDKDGKQVGSTYVGSKSKADWAAIIDSTLAEVSK